MSRVYIVFELRDFSSIVLGVFDTSGKAERFAEDYADGECVVQLEDEYGLLEGLYIRSFEVG